MPSREILLIDDSVDLRIPMRRMLELEGYSVQCAENGLVALEMLRQAPSLPGLILLDLMMPVMDGPTFRNEQMRDPKLSSIPVIVLSASSVLLTEAGKMGVHAYLPKPIDIEALLSLTEKILS